MKLEEKETYGSTMKLDGNNYELWTRAFMISVMGHKRNELLIEDEPNNKVDKYSM